MFAFVTNDYFRISQFFISPLDEVNEGELLIRFTSILRKRFFGIIFLIPILFLFCLVNVRYKFTRNMSENTINKIIRNIVGIMDPNWRYAFCNSWSTVCPCLLSHFSMSAQNLPSNFDLFRSLTKYSLPDLLKTR